MVTTFTLAAALTLVPGALAGERVPEAKEIGQMAKNAATPADHAKVAQSYAAHANNLDAKAARIEREIEASKPAPKSAMETKWPAMVVNARERKERLAMQARRAAEESRRLAGGTSCQAGRT
jgi:hypothetical protein